MEKDGLTLTGFLLNQQQSQEEATGDFTILLSSIQLACKTISTAVRKAGILGMYGLEGSVNVQGEEVKKLDILSHDNFVQALRYSTKVSVMVSEEVEEPIVLQESKGRYCVVFDPLDGSSNIDCNVSVGSIFGIYKKKDSSPGTVADVLQKGTELVAAGYCMYGSSTQLVLTFKGSGVHVFTHDPSVGEFLLTQKDVKIPSNGGKTIFSANEGNAKYWYEPVTNFVNRVKFADKPYSARYVGSMVSDLHRTLLYGGIFLYPNDKKSKDGKLRLLYEANPVSITLFLRC
mmetsp:Transcript_26238/g.57285  ORF Transcript_26238/g.57285 Transcript_26238/m.57285 type:complete len:288 (-) Transcript_26238:4585-5448(-)